MDSPSFSWRTVDSRCSETCVEGCQGRLQDCTFSKERVERYVERLKNSKPLGSRLGRSMLMLVVWRTRSRTKQRPLDMFFGAAKAGCPCAIKTWITSAGD